MTKRQRAEQKLGNVMRMALRHGLIERNLATGAYRLSQRNQTGRGLRPRFERWLLRVNGNRNALPAGNLAT
jgi:hypothetical protein